MPSEQAEHAAGQREQHALGEQLADDAAARPADRRRGSRSRAAGRSRAPAAGWRRWRTRSAARSRRRRRARAATTARCGPAPRGSARTVKLPFGPSAFGNLRRKSLGRQLQPRLRLLERHARLQPARGLEVVPLVGRVRVELERHPDLRRRPELRKSKSPEHADDRVAARRSARSSSRPTPGSLSNRRLPELLARGPRPCGPSGRSSSAREAPAQRRSARRTVGRSRPTRGPIAAAPGSCRR